jgi:hypothetical protein
MRVFAISAVWQKVVFFAPEIPFGKAAGSVIAELFLFIYGHCGIFACNYLQCKCGLSAFE